MEIARIEVYKAEPFQISPSTPDLKEAGLANEGLKSTFEDKKDPAEQDVADQEKRSNNLAEHWVVKKSLESSTIWMSRYFIIPTARDPKACGLITLLSVHEYR